MPRVAVRKEDTIVLGPLFLGLSPEPVILVPCLEEESVAVPGGKLLHYDVIYMGVKIGKHTRVVKA
jgi:hypothetical protein